MWWTSFVLLFFQPVVVINYASVFQFAGCFAHSGCLIAYLFVCYFICLHVLLHLSYGLWHMAKRSNRRPMILYMIYCLRCTVRDLLGGDCALPHWLHYYLAACCLWTFYCNVLLDGVQLKSILIFSVGQYMRGRHYGA